MPLLTIILPLIKLTLSFKQEFYFCQFADESVLK